MDSIYKMVDAVNGLLWGKNILVFMLIGAALYFSFKTKENTLRSLPISPTFRKLGESEVILTLSIILMKTFVTSGLFPKSFFKFLYTTCLIILEWNFCRFIGGIL